MGWWKQPKKVCFLCAGSLDGDYGEIEYKHAQGTEKEKICKLCVARLDEDEVKKEDDESV